MRDSITALMTKAIEGLPGEEKQKVQTHIQQSAQLVQLAEAERKRNYVYLLGTQLTRR